MLFIGDDSAAPALGGPILLGSCGLSGSIAEPTLGQGWPAAAGQRRKQYVSNLPPIR